MINKEKSVREFTEAIAEEARQLLEKFDEPWNQRTITKRGLRLSAIVELRTGEEWCEEQEMLLSASADVCAESTVIEQQGLIK